MLSLWENYYPNFLSVKLLEKLHIIDFSKTSLTWFWSYFCGQSVCVASKTSTSVYRDINLYVPQESVLGLQLYCINMNYLKDHLDDHRTFRLLYADDLQIYLEVPGHCIDQGIAYLFESTQTVAKWGISNFLT